MLESGKISIRQVAVLFYLSMIGDMIIILPPIAAGYAHQNGWIVSLVSIPLGLVLIWMMLKLASLYPDANLVQICNRLLGKWLGSLISMTYLVFFIISGAIYIREVGDFLTTQLFANTPIGIFIFFL